MVETSSGAVVNLGGMVVAEHEVTVPVDHADPSRGQIMVFAREVWDCARADLPWLLYLHGGPGHESTRPTWSPISPDWLGRALRDYRVVLMDARGTGRSTPIGSAPDAPADLVAERLALFRADSVVRDAEYVRRAVCGDQQWTVLGESAGGFALVTYLSIAPEGVREALFAGGLPSVGGSPDEVYRRTHTGMLDRSRRYYARYPTDRDRVARLHEWLAGRDVRLPSGDRLTSPRLRQLGILLGVNGGEEQLHYLLERDPTSPAFLHDVTAATPWGTRDIGHVVLHEACWADGYSTGWSAQRTMPTDYDADSTLFTGEHVYPWMLDPIDGYRDLAPWGQVAEVLAERRWPRLYDEGRLRRCTVPCAAVIYADDAYVPADLSGETAGLIPTMTVWEDHEHRHDGLDTDGDHVLDRLIALARGTQVTTARMV
ncbi:MAG TPA: alpha/beta fold hydrolase [Pseudonocardiaceae bacterium]|jgi:pimeloyl-ACP methyl ester carboxylesterase